MPVSLSFATAPIAPVPSTSVCPCSLPWIVSSGPDALLRVAVVVHERRVRPHLAREDAKQVQLAAVRVGDGLEDVRHRAGVADLGQVLGAKRRRQALDDQVEQAVRADVPGGRAAADREELALGDELLQRLGHLLAGDLAALQVALHQLVGRLRHDVHQLVVVLVGGRAQVVGDVDGLVAPGALAVVVGDHVDEVDHAVELVLAADRKLHRDALRREPRLERVERREEVGPLAVEQVHEDEAREAQLLAAFPQPLRPHLDAHDARHRHDRALHHPERAQHVGLEAGLAGRVDQVDRAALPVEVRDRGRDRHLAPALLVVEVRDGRLLGDAPQPVHGARLEQQGLDERGLAGAAMADHGDVSDLAGLRSRHAWPPGESVGRAGGYRAGSGWSYRNRSADARSRLPWSLALRRRIALVWSWDTRDSVTPRTSPISRSVSSS